jgi:hypothetical protein
MAEGMSHISKTSSCNDLMSRMISVVQLSLTLSGEIGDMCVAVRYTDSYLYEPKVRNPASTGFHGLDGQFFYLKFTASKGIK